MRDDLLNFGEFYMELKLLKMKEGVHKPFLFESVFHPMV